MSVKKLENRINKIKSDLMELMVVRPGSLTKQKRGEQGEYYQLSYTHNNRGKTEYIRKEFAEEVRKQTNEYKKFKKLTNEWVASSIELSKLKMKLEKEKEKKKEKK